MLYDRSYCIKNSKGEYKKQEDFAKGEPERPLSEEELISKFTANTEKKSLLLEWRIL